MRLNSFCNCAEGCVPSFANDALANSIMAANKPVNFFFITEVLIVTVMLNSRKAINNKILFLENETKEKNKAINEET